MTNTPELRDHRIGQTVPQVIFVTVLELFIKHKIETEFKASFKHKTNELALSA
jgi:hypothetical protein